MPSAAAFCLGSEKHDSGLFYRIAAEEWAEKRVHLKRTGDRERPATRSGLANQRLKKTAPRGRGHPIRIRRRYADSVVIPPVQRRYSPDIL